MSEYTVIDIYSFNQRKQKEYDKFKEKRVTLSNKQSIGKQMEFKFEKSTIKSKLENVYKEEFTTGRLVIVTSDFTMIIKLNEE